MREASIAAAKEARAVDGSSSQQIERASAQRNMWVLLRQTDTDGSRVVATSARRNIWSAGHGSSVINGSTDVSLYRRQHGGSTLFVKSAVFRAALLGLCALSTLGTGCGRDISINLQIVAPTDMNPFMGPMAGTLVRVGFEGDPLSVREMAYSSGMTIALDPRPTDIRSTARLRVDLLRDNVIVAQGSTPPIAWSAVGGQMLRVFVAPLDRALPAPGGPMLTARADFSLIDLGGAGVLAATLPPGVATGIPDTYFLPSHRQDPHTFDIREAFDGDTAVVRISGAFLLQREARARLITGNNDMLTEPTVVAERRLLRAPGVARSTSEEVFLLGGKTSANMLSNRIDRVDRLGNITGTTDVLTTGRERAGVIRLRYSPTASVSPMFFVFGGQDPQCMGCTSAERWIPGNAAMPLILGPSVDQRVGFSAMCLAFAPGTGDSVVCSRILIVGGYDRVTGALATEDVLVDASRIIDASPDVVLRSENLLTTRRRGLQAVLGRDGSRVVITGGTDAMDMPVYSMEVLGVADLASITRVAQQDLLVSNPASIAMADGSVMIAGGLDRASNMPSKGMWILRGPATALPPATSR